MQGATDAARAAADIVFSEEGLSTIITGIEVARQIFQRMQVRCRDLLLPCACCHAVGCSVRMHATGRSWLHQRVRFELSTRCTCARTRPWSPHTSCAGHE